MGEGGKGLGQGRKGAVRAPPKERFNKTAAILGLGANSAGHRAGRSPSQGSRSKGLRGFHLWNPAAAWSNGRGDKCEM